MCIQGVNTTHYPVIARGVHSFLFAAVCSRGCESPRYCDAPNSCICIDSGYTGTNCDTRKKRGPRGCMVGERGPKGVGPGDQRGGVCGREEGCGRRDGTKGVWQPRVCGRWQERGQECGSQGCVARKRGMAGERGVAAKGVW